MPVAAFVTTHATTRLANPRNGTLLFSSDLRVTFLSTHLTLHCSRIYNTSRSHHVIRALHSVFSGHSLSPALERIVPASFSRVLKTFPDTAWGKGAASLGGRQHERSHHSHSATSPMAVSVEGSGHAEGNSANGVNRHSDLHAGSPSTDTHASAPPSSHSPSTLRLGFLGLGIMGTAMAARLLNAGHSLAVWNRSADKCEPLVALGARALPTPSDVTAASDITFAMLADPEAALEVACGLQGAVHGLSAGKGYVDVSTVDAAAVHHIASAVRGQKALYLEAPVSGSKKPAEDGTLIFLSAGDKELFETARPFLDIMGKSAFFLGKDGNGAAMKLVVNMVMGSMMAAFSEGLSLGERAGLDPATIVEVISQGAIASPMFALKGPHMVKSTYPPAFPLKHQQKDLRLALALGDQVEQPLPVAAAANEVFKRGRAQGLGDRDFSAVMEAVRGDANSSKDNTL